MAGVVLSGRSGGSPGRRDDSANVMDYGALGDGATDDTEAIQAALDAGRGEVVFPAGTYMLASTVYVQANTVLSLAPNAVVKRGSSVNRLIANYLDGTEAGYTGAGNIEIRGGVIDGDADTYTSECALVGIGHASDVRIIGVTFRSLYNWHMIELNGVQHGLIRDCSFDDYGTEAVGTEMVQLDYMWSEGFPWTALHDDTPCEHITVERCRFSNGVRGVGSHSSKAGVYHSHITIRNNSFDTLRSEAVKALAYKHLDVSGNSFVDCGAGVLVAPHNTSNRCVDVSICGNSATGTTGRPITVSPGVDGGVVEGNYVSGAGTHGIGVDLSSDWRIVNNTVEDCGQTGIWCYGSDNVLIQGNHSTGNNTSVTPTRYDLAVGVVGASDYSTDVVVIGNTCGTFGASYADPLLLAFNTVEDSVTLGTDATGAVMRSNRVAGVLDAT